MDKPNRLAWFNGDAEVLDLYLRICYVAHLWDDLVDGDKKVNLTDFVLNATVRIPASPAYQRYGSELRVLGIVSMAGYLAANLMAKSGDAHKLEIAHYLRYQIINAGIFLIVATHGLERSAEVIAEAMPHMVPERLEQFIKEHSPC